MIISQKIKSWFCENNTHVYWYHDAQHKTRRKLRSNYLSSYLMNKIFQSLLFQNDLIREFLVLINIYFHSNSFLSTNG